ncbi:MAG: PPOX class F420-dependent oxidoreductase [Acidimicrobiia bacterium]|jgi:PPOX class probable F420-dependent enzyme|nr:MAG: PPOX class F420-dependent oxidoreductase [Acidimicrobiia bacterium]
MLDPDIRDFVRSGHFAALSTLMPDGTPQTQVMWVDADDTHLLINTEDGRQKQRNVERDPRVTVLVWDAENPYRYAEVRGTVVDMVRGPEARNHIDHLSHRYFGKPYSNPIRTERIIWRIAPDRQYLRG